MRKRRWIGARPPSVTEALNAPALLWPSCCARSRVMIDEAAAIMQVSSAEASDLVQTAGQEIAEQVATDVPSSRTSRSSLDIETMV